MGEDKNALGKVLGTSIDCMVQDAPEQPSGRLDVEAETLGARIKVAPVGNARATEKVKVDADKVAPRSKQN